MLRKIWQFIIDCLEALADEEDQARHRRKRPP